MRVLIVDLNGYSLGFDEFVRPIERILKSANVDYFSRHYSSVTPADIQLADRIILSGTPLKDFGFLEGDFSWLRSIRKPVLGICAGMQVLALAFNGKLKTFKHVGMERIKTALDNPLFCGDFEAYSLHSKTATSDEFIAIAKGKNVQAIQHKIYPFFGVLFHPEVRNPAVIEKFLKIN